ncbi:hypothetical protein N0V90_008146 [Kalmusia sp. IMI 367209]|nr:hypothetical protein N0V90_008146 [Kalmusia sp. IMI 367209]
MRSSWLLFALLAIVALSTAFSVEEALNIDGINAYLHHGIKRQAEGTGASSSAAPSTSEEASSSDEPSTTPEPSSTPAPSTIDSTSEAETTPEASQTQSSPSRPSSTTASTTEALDSSTLATSTRASTPILSTKALVSTGIEEFTTIITTISNGQTLAQTSLASRTVERTTGTAVSTLSADSSNGSGGLSSTNKAIIGGVIGGVGGAILLGGIAYVCWRMWGKKKRVTEDDADLMANTGAALGDKPQGTPFQSNLEQYHNPGGRPNAAANF